MKRMRFESLQVGDVVKCRFGTRTIVKVETTHKQRAYNPKYDSRPPVEVVVDAIYFDDGTCLKPQVDPPDWLENASVVR